MGGYSAVWAAVWVERVSFITRQVLPSHMLCLQAGSCGVLLFWSFFGGVDAAQLGILGILPRAVGGMCSQSNPCFPSAGRLGAL